MDKKYAIGIDRGATLTRAVIGDENGFLANPVSLPTSEGIGLLIKLLKEELKRHKLNPRKIKGIGVGASGLVDPEKKKIVSSANAPEISFRPLEKELGIPLKLENDCNTAVVGEKIYGDGKDVDDLAYISISTGVGAGVYYQGRLLKSSGSGRAAEAGFFVIDCEGRCQTFGKRGVWEAYCSGQNIPNFIRTLLEKEKRKTKLKGLEEIKGEDLFRLAKKGDEVAKDYLEEINKLNAIGFANVINAYNPELITTGGAVVLNNPEILDGMKKYLSDYVVNPVPEIKITELGEEINLYGALVFSEE